VQARKAPKRCKKVKKECSTNFKSPPFFMQEAILKRERRGPLTVVVLQRRAFLSEKESFPYLREEKSPTSGAKSNSTASGAAKKGEPASNSQASPREPEEEEGRPTLQRGKTTLYQWTNFPSPSDCDQMRKKACSA
jgi:hypothetical protein